MVRDRQALRALAGPLDHLRQREVGTPPDLSRSFRLEQPESSIGQARLYLCGLGLAVPFVDGRRAGDEWLAPGNTSYRDTLRYQTLYVTDLLKGAGNSTDTASNAPIHRLDILLGNGWYRSHQGWVGVAQPDFSKRPWELVVELHIRYRTCASGPRARATGPLPARGRFRGKSSRDARWAASDQRADTDISPAKWPR